MQGKFKMRSSGSKVTDTVFLDDEGNFISRNFTHALKTTQFLLQSDYNEGNFTWKLLYFFVCFSPYIRGIFLNLQTSFFRFMCYERCKFGCDQSLTKGTFLGEKSIFSFVHRLPFQGFNWNFEPPFFHAWATHDERFVTIDRKWRAIYLVNKVPSVCISASSTLQWPRIH